MQLSRAYNENILLDRVVRTIEKYGMFRSGDRVAVAVSGGADSVCLLHVLREVAARWQLSLGVLHINHNLRGAESQGDAEFVRGLAEGFGLPFTLCELDLSRAGGNLEERARNGRLRCFRDALTGGAPTRVAVGHTRNDQAETVLFRFLRGAGVTGLSAIRPVTAEGLVRPLIDVDREEIVGYLNSRGLEWREDASNATLDFARNRIRHQLLPQLKREWNPGLVETLAHTAELSLAEEAYWRGETERLAKGFERRKDGSVVLRTGELITLPMAAARRLVRRAMEEAGGGRQAAGFRHIEAVLELAARPLGKGRVQVPGLEVWRSFEWLRFGRAWRQQGFSVLPGIPGIQVLPGGNLAMSLEMLENSETSGPPRNVYNSNVGCLDWDRLSGTLELRNWRPGDQYQPAGVPAAKKIKTLFHEARIPVWERAQWPVLTDAGSIVWAGRFGVAAPVAAGPGSTKVLAVGELDVR